MATPLVLAASTIRYRSSKEEKQTTKTTYDYKKPLKTVITTVFSGLLMFIFTTAAVGLKPLTSVRRKTKGAPDKGDLVTSEV